MLAGGRTDNGLKDDTWEWDGTTWTERRVQGPGIRLHAYGAFDSRRKRLVVYGGLQPVERTVTPLHDTWEWDGERWERRDTTGIEAFPSGITYDEPRGQVVLVAVDGTMPPDGLKPSAVWAWDGTRWSRVSDGFNGPVLSPSQPLASSVSGLMMLDGAIAPGSDVSVTWLWRGSAWARSAAGEPPGKETLVPQSRQCKTGAT